MKQNWTEGVSGCHKASDKCPVNSAAGIILQLSPFGTKGRLSSHYIPTSISHWKHTAPGSSQGPFSKRSWEWQLPFGQTPDHWQSPFIPQGIMGVVAQGLQRWLARTGPAFRGRPASFYVHKVWQDYEMDPDLIFHEDLKLNFNF